MGVDQVLVPVEAASWSRTGSGESGAAMSRHLLLATPTSRWPDRAAGALGVGDTLRSGLADGVASPGADPGRPGLPE
ncbi:hypothetical protein PSN13_00047 [Micromonospora saelicesensis]|uniref:Uncharacterized protein n=2 Tax=Micromonospora saelicesensis TaxID=285676 RepID=A0A328P005_9ACTN|nr:hypothetical protein PSN13_00047 [Micromonospora saelicesensis]